MYPHHNTFTRLRKIINNQFSKEQLKLRRSGQLAMNEQCPHVLVVRFPEPSAADLGATIVDLSRNGESMRQQLPKNAYGNNNTDGSWKRWKNEMMRGRRVSRKLRIAALHSVAETGYILFPACEAREKVGRRVALIISQSLSKYLRERSSFRDRPLNCRRCHEREIAERQQQMAHFHTIFNHEFSSYRSVKFRGKLLMKCQIFCSRWKGLYSLWVRQELRGISRNKRIIGNCSSLVMILRRYL